MQGKADARRNFQNSLLNLFISHYSVSEFGIVWRELGLTLTLADYKDVLPKQNR